jgi:hypothetical protein
MECTENTNLNILNKGNEPTFLNVRKRQVIDLTLGTTLEEYLSDHRYISFKIGSQVFKTVIYRNPKETDWAGYRQDLSALIGGTSKNIRSRLNLELAADEMQQSILLSYYHNCRTRLAGSPKKVPWWSTEISKLRVPTRRLFNRAKMTGDWDSYRNALTRYNTAIRKAKRQSWRKYCQRKDQIPSGLKWS